MTINRFSSRRTQLDQSFLNQRLQGAKSYDRIAGYFSSSMLEVAGEALESITGLIRIVCNSDLDVRDVETAKAANFAIRREWCASQPENFNYYSKPRFARLYEFLRSGKMQVKVLPLEKFGLVHGKAGVITLANGNKTSFIGSTNETYRGWKLNYELLWEDDSSEAIQWVQEEFDALWNSPFACNLCDFVVEDIGRLVKRTVIPSVDIWREQPEAAAPIIETPVYRQEYGLWEHQKYFVNLTFNAHRTPDGARFVLADMVGLGKTMQLAMSAMLMALYGDKPVLILVPKPLLWQWQEEMKNLLDMPSAIWDGKRWIDENGIEYPITGAAGIKKCPRQIGLVSQGLITRKTEAAEYLKQLTYECIIVDEAHRARRKNLAPDKEQEKPEPNNLMAFLCQISTKTKSLLLATATPVQLYPVEAWDLLNILAPIENESVLGNIWSHWRKAEEALAVVTGTNNLPEDDLDLWSWIRNPLPPSSEDRDFEMIRRSLKLPDSEAVASGDAWSKLRKPDQRRVKDLGRNFAQQHNPFIRHIIRRTREFLESTIDPETGEPYLQPVKVELFGERDKDAIRLPPYLKEAYEFAEKFCQLLGSRMKGAGFLKTLLLRRVGSTIHAGMNTAKNMLQDWDDIEDEDDREEEIIEVEKLKSLTIAERESLQAFVNALEANQERDPKYQAVVEILLRRGWLEQGCIIFSQYFDSIFWLASQLSQELLQQEPIGIYAGGQKSGIFLGGVFSKQNREELKQMVRRGEMRLLLGTDAASEGLNLQRLGTLINLDLPWNPTRLEQRKGRIQRIGQLRNTVYVYNMRYKGSVEDRVHELLSNRLAAIHQIFGQIPDVLEDLWIEIAMGKIERAKQTIDAVPKQHPFEIKYHKLEKIAWESCTEVLDGSDRKKSLLKGWENL